MADIINNSQQQDDSNSPQNIEMSNEIEIVKLTIQLKEETLSILQKEFFAASELLTNSQKIYNEQSECCQKLQSIVQELKNKNASREIIIEAQNRFTEANTTKNELLEKHKILRNNKNEINKKITILNDEISKLSNILSQNTQAEVVENKEITVTKEEEPKIIQNNEHDNIKDNKNNDTKYITKQLNIFINKISKGNFDYDDILIKIQLLWSHINCNIKKYTIIATILPSIIVFLYCLLIHDNMYISKSYFTIKANNQEKSFDFSIQGLLNGSSNRDLYTATAYIKSLDLFYDLEKNIEIAKHYQHHDLVSSLSSNPSNFEIEDYWHDVVQTKIDPESEIVELSVRSYDPKFSKELSDLILTKVEEMVNNMSNRAQNDAIHNANIEVQKAEEKVKQLTAEIKIFRNEHNYLDPSSEADHLLTIISNIETQISTTKAELSQKQTYLRNDSIEIVSLNHKIDSYQKELTELRERLASVSSNNNEQKESISHSLGAYENLQLEYQFAKKTLELALTNLETAKQISISKSKYFIEIDSPKISSESQYPKPFIAAFLTLIVTLLGLSTISLLVSAIREHLGV